MNCRCCIPAIGLFLLLGIPAGEAVAEDNGFRRNDRDRLYGENLMTAEERQKYRQQIWNLRTEAEREHFRDRHRQEMQERAWATGSPVPEEGDLSEKSGTSERKWPADGLRRWPESRGQAEGGLRRRPAEALSLPAEKQNWTERVREERNVGQNPGASAGETSGPKGGWRSGDGGEISREPGCLPPDAPRPGAGVNREETTPPPAGLRPVAE